MATHSNILGALTVKDKSKRKGRLLKTVIFGTAVVVSMSCCTAETVIRKPKEDARLHWTPTLPLSQTKVDLELWK